MTELEVKYTLLEMKNRVRERRDKLEIPQNRLAEACGVSRQTIHAIEVEKYQPTVMLALKLAKNLNVPVEKLFILEGND